MYLYRKYYLLYGGDGTRGWDRYRSGDGDGHDLRLVVLLTGRRRGGIVGLGLTWQELEGQPGRRGRPESAARPA